MATAKKKTSDLLNKIKSGASQKKVTKKDERWTIRLEPKDNQDFLDLCCLSTLVKQLTPTQVERDKVVKEKLLKQFTDKWWEDRKLPQNPRVVLSKENMDDMSFIFMVKHRSGGLTNVVPNVEDIPEDTTVEDILFDMLTSSKVGLSDDNADALLNEEDGEITVIQRLELAGSFDELLEKSETESGVNKLLAFLGAGDDDEIEVLDENEKKLLLRTVQIVQIKDGFFERAHKYVDNAEQLRKLLQFVKATLQISNYEFAISDTPTDRAKRLEDAAIEYLTELEY